MKFLVYLPLFIAFQLLGEFIKGFFSLPVPGATIGMFLLFLFLFIVPENKTMLVSAQKLILHLPLFFIPAGVGIMTYTEVLKTDGLALFVAVFVTTIISLVLAAKLTSHLLRSEAFAIEVSDSPVNDSELPK